MEAMMPHSREHSSQPQELDQDLGANHTADEYGDAFDGEALIDTYNNARPPQTMDMVQEADANEHAISNAVEELNPEPESRPRSATIASLPRAAPSLHAITAEDKEAYPFDDQTGRYKLLGWNSKEKPLEHEGSMVEVRMPLGTSTVDNHERARYSSEPQTIGTGLDAGVGWLGYLDDARRDLLVTRCPIKLQAPLRRMTARLMQFKSPEVVIPALMKLEEIAEHYPNHVWGKMLRIFVAEGYKGPAIYNMLPQGARTPLALDVANNRPANYLQHAIGREQDHAMLEEPKPYFRMIRMNKSKGHAKVQKRKMDDDDHDVDIEDDHNEASTSKRQKLSKTRSNTQAYPLSADEMENQQRVDIQIQRTKMLLSDRLMVRNRDLVHQSFRERLQLVEKEWYEAYNKFLSDYHLFQTDKTMLPPICNQNNEPFEVILTVVEHEQRLNEATANDEAMLRNTAYGVLEFFLASFEDTLSAELSLAYQKAPIEVRQAMASYVAGQLRPMPVLKAERTFSASTDASTKFAGALSNGHVKSSSSTATLPKLNHLDAVGRSSSRREKQRSSSPMVPTGNSYAPQANRPAQVRFAEHSRPGTPQRPLQQTQSGAPPRSSVRPSALSPFGMSHSYAPTPTASGNFVHESQMQQWSSAPLFPPPMSGKLPQNDIGSQQTVTPGQYGHFGGKTDEALSSGTAKHSRESNDFDRVLASLSDTNRAAPSPWRPGTDPDIAIPAMQNKDPVGFGGNFAESAPLTETQHKQMGDDSNFDVSDFSINVDDDMSFSELLFNPNSDDWTPDFGTRPPY
ncbi:uncharacterized protein AB675_5836 [Cyphellophora attinorum]|uniref:Uncharacterized protein n=1 Tax=Cyphellophora attinorum TaxID=1664694 RepID=A0A0N1H7T6_9EURO|nr:uncharacterized protein AB675_5836 [Phialophora attinorum]KPI38876.1 hypothetical protein AB675_5836 [Phialophora attinorum]